MHCSFINTYLTVSTSSIIHLLFCPTKYLVDFCYGISQSMILVPQFCRQYFCQTKVVRTSIPMPLENVPSTINYQMHKYSIWHRVNKYKNNEQQSPFIQEVLQCYPNDVYFDRAPTNSRSMRKTQYIQFSAQFYTSEFRLP